MADIVVVMEEGRISYCGSPRSDSSLDLQKLDSETGQESEVVDLLGHDCVQQEIQDIPVPLIVSQETSFRNAKPTSLPIILGDQSLRGLSHFMSPTNHVFGSEVKVRGEFREASGDQQPQLKTSKAVTLIEEEQRIEGHVQATVYRLE